MKLVQVVILMSLFSGAQAFACANITPGTVTGKSPAAAKSTVNSLTRTNGDSKSTSTPVNKDPNATH